MAGADQRAWPVTRFAGLPAWAAVAVLAALVGLTLLGIARPAPSTGASSSPSANEQSDMVLYRDIAKRVGAGESYYVTAAEEQRAHHYPLRPFVTMRLPTLATLTGHLGVLATEVVLYAIVFAAFLMVRACVRTRETERVAFAVQGALVLGLIACLVPQSVYFHETWAGALIILSLACRSRERWIASLVFGIAACAIRELAIPYLCVMAAAAFIEGSRREAMGWLAGLLVAFAILAGHAMAVATVVTPHDLASPGWDAFGGWSFVLRTFRYSPLLAGTPTPLVAIVVPLALFGWVAWRDAFGFRGAFLLCGYSFAFMVVGRPDNDYWGVIPSPLLLVGLVFAPAAFRDLFHALRGARAGRLRLAD